MKISRRFTEVGRDPFAALTFTERSSKIANPDGSVVFEAPAVTVPIGWSQVAVDVLAQKYFRKAGVPARLNAVDEDGVPTWLRRSMSTRPPIDAAYACRAAGCGCPAATRSLRPGCARAGWTVAPASNGEAACG